MKIEPNFFPILTCIVCILCGLILANGYRSGFLKRLVSLAFWLVAFIGGYLIAFQTPESLFLENEFARQAPENALILRMLVFVICVMIIRILFVPVYSMIGWLKKIKVVSFADHLAGLILSMVNVWIFLSLFILILQSGVIQNGMQYIYQSPLHYVKEANEDYFNQWIQKEIKEIVEYEKR